MFPSDQTAEILRGPPPSGPSRADDSTTGAEVIGRAEAGPYWGASDEDAPVARVDLVDTDRLNIPRTPRASGDGHDDPWMPGRVVADRYLLERRLGGGAMGIVFLARDRLLKKQIALKVLRPSLAQNRGTVRRFLREVALAHSVTHPHVVRIYDTGEAHGLPYFSMEYLQGQTLDEFIGESAGHLPPMTIREIRDLSLEILEGLEAAHRAGVIHRDLKPANVLLTHRGAIVMDFGVAGFGNIPAATLPDPEDATQSIVHTEAGTIFGSPAYMAPELWEGAPATVQSDLYSFGVMLYQLLTGRLPIEAANAHEFLEKLRSVRPIPVRTIRKDVPRSMAALVAACMDHDPERRPATAALAARRIAPLARRRRGGYLAAVGAAVALLAVGGWALRRQPTWVEKGLPDVIAERDLAAAVRSWDVGDHATAIRLLDRLAVRAPESAAVGFWRAVLEHERGDEPARLAACAGREFEGDDTWRGLADAACSDDFTLGEPVASTLNASFGALDDTYLPLAIEHGLVQRLESTRSRGHDAVEREAKLVLQRVTAPPRGPWVPVPVRWTLAEVELRVALGQFTKALEGIEALVVEHPEAPLARVRAAQLQLLLGDDRLAASHADLVENEDPRPALRRQLERGRLRDAWLAIEADAAGPYHQASIEMWCGYALRFEVGSLPAQCSQLGPGLVRALWNSGAANPLDDAVMNANERIIVAQQFELDSGECIQRGEYVPLYTHVSPPFEAYTAMLRVGGALCPADPARGNPREARETSDRLVETYPNDPWVLLLQAQVDEINGAHAVAAAKHRKVANFWRDADAELPLVQKLRARVASVRRETAPVDTDDSVPASTARRR